MAVVDNDISRADLEQLAAGGIVGTTMQASLLGVDAFRDTGGLLRELAELNLFADVQVEADQLVEIAPLLEPSGIRVLIDHCGRPVPGAGLDRPGFRTLLGLGSTGRYFVKISGLVKCSVQRYPWATPGRTCTRCWRHSPPTVACGDRTGRSSERRNGSTTAPFSR